MARIRHIAFMSDHPGRAADFYKKTLGFHEIFRFGLDGDPEIAPRPCAVVLTDGNINISIIKADEDQIGLGLDHVGFHHFGVVVDDVDSWADSLKAAGVEQVTTADQIPMHAHFEIKFRGPDGVVFDISPSPWPGASPVPEQGTHFGGKEVEEKVA